MPEALMTSAEVADLLGVSKSMLSRWRTLGGGPVEVEDALVWLTPTTPRYRRPFLMSFLLGTAA